MSNLNWFHMERWSHNKWEDLLESRTIEIKWFLSEDPNLPRIIKLPEGLDLTKKSIDEYIFKEFNHKFHNWFPIDYTN